MFSLYNQLLLTFLGSKCRMVFGAEASTSVWWRTIVLGNNESSYSTDGIGLFVETLLYKSEYLRDIL